MIVSITNEQEPYRVAERCNVEILLEMDQDLNAGDWIAFQFPNSWSLVSGPSHTRGFQADDPQGEHYVSVRALESTDAAFEISIRPRHLNHFDGLARHGRLITASLKRGTIPAGTPVRLGYENTFAPYVAEEESLWVRVNDTPPAVAPTLRVLSAGHKSFRVVAPSFAKPGETFDVLLVSLDRFDNASSTAFKEESLTLSDGTPVAENISFTGSMRVPVKMDAPGIYRFVFRETVSNAVRVGDGVAGLYWGDIHVHTKLSHDAQGADPYGYARDVSGLDFAAVTDHWESIGPEGYRILKRWAAEADQPGSFIAIPADERNPGELRGHHNVYFVAEAVMDRYEEIQASSDIHTPSSFEKFRNANPSEVMFIPHHTGIAWGAFPANGTGSAIDWDACDDHGFRPVMEIYSHHGQSEAYNPSHPLAYEWNRLRNPERRANTSVPGPFYAQDYWMRGKRVGVIASSDEHSGQAGRRHGGIAAVFADSLTREELFKALRERRCYGTTGERILVDFKVDGLPMGAVGKRSSGAKLNIALNVWGTDTLLRVDVLRHRFGVEERFVPVVSFCPRPESRDAVVSFEDKVEGPCMYYARVTQQPLAWPGMAWTSPVWIETD